jgi:uncharacterized protein YdeI (YjbR/CyaY-like superfamily)
MTDVGLAKVRAAKKSGMWKKEGKPPRVEFDPPVEFLEALKNHDKAKKNFEKMAPSNQKHYIIWISMAKREETRKKRIVEAISLLEKDEKLGLK